MQDGSEDMCILAFHADTAKDEGDRRGFSLNGQMHVGIQIVLLSRIQDGNC